MTPPSLPLCAILAAALSLCACVADPFSADAPKVVRGQPLPPYKVHEECLRLEPGDRVDFTFDSTEPVDFNLHYHEGKTVVMPLVREKTRGDAAVFAPQVAQDYCLMWETGPAGAMIDYSVRLRRAAS